MESEYCSLTGFIVDDNLEFFKGILVDSVSHMFPLILKRHRMIRSHGQSEEGIGRV